MVEKLASLETRYEELNHLLSDPNIIADQTKYQKYTKAYSI